MAIVTIVVFYTPSIKEEGIPVDHEHKLTKQTLFPIKPHCNVHTELRFAILPHREAEPARRAPWLQAIQHGRVGNVGTRCPSRLHVATVCMWKTFNHRLDIQYQSNV